MTDKLSKLKHKNKKLSKQIQTHKEQFSDIVYNLTHIQTLLIGTPLTSIMQFNNKEKDHNSKIDQNQ